MRTYKDGGMALEPDALVRVGSSWKITLGENQAGHADLK
jgi:hypothetical protein